MCCLFIFNTEAKKISCFKRKIMLFLLVTGEGLLADISFAPQHILLMTPYKLDYQRPLWITTPARTHLQQFHGRGAKNSPDFFNETLCSLSHLFTCWFSFCPIHLLRMHLKKYFVAFCLFLKSFVLLYHILMFDWFMLILFLKRAEWSKRFPRVRMERTVLS